MPVEVFVSIVKEYKWLVSGLVHKCIYYQMIRWKVYRLNAMYPRTKQQTHDKGSMVRAQYCSEWTDLGNGMARLFDSFVPRWLMKAQPLLCVAI